MLLAGAVHHHRQNPNDSMKGPIERGERAVDPLSQAERERRDARVRLELNRRLHQPVEDTYEITSLFPPRARVANTRPRWLRLA